MEFAKFIRSLRGYKKVLILIPVFAGIVTFILVKKMPKTYRSTARIATGLVERSDEFINKNVLMDSKISQEFSNIIQMMLLKKLVNQVSYQLMIHDLTHPGNLYRKQSSMVEVLTQAEKKDAIRVLTSKYQSMEELSLFDPNQNFLNKLLISKNFDYQSLTKKLNIYRLQTSDYIYLDFESESPMLSAVVLNSLSQEFIDYYTAIVNQKKEKTVLYLDSLLKVREASVRLKMNNLKTFKIRNGILDANSQANVLMTQIADFQAKKQEAQKNIAAYTGVLQNLTARLAPSERKALENDITRANQDILNTRSMLTSMNELYIKNNFDPKYKKRIDSLQNSLSGYIEEANDKSALNNSSEKQDLLKEKLNTEIGLEIAKNSVASVDQMVAGLSSKLSVLAPSQANIESYEKDIENESKEYADLVNKFNQTKLESSFPLRLRQVEMAMPEAPLPSRKILLVLLAVIVSFLFVVGSLFVMHYFDHRVNDSQELADSTGQIVLGSLNLVRGQSLSPDEMWGQGMDLNNVRTLKSQLRSIRFEIDNEPGDGKIVSITSLQASEGKTFLSLNLAYAYKMINKKVVLIDGNFDNPHLSELIKPALFLEDFLSSKIPVDEMEELAAAFVVMGNKGNDVSLLEITSQAIVAEKLAALKQKFDIILIEIPALDYFNKAREWITVSNKVVPVFSAGHTLSKEKKKDIQYLDNLNGKLAGWVTNRIDRNEPKVEGVKIKKNRPV